VASSWTRIWFDGPDDAYLVAAAIRRYLQANVIPDLLVVPSDRGPALELPKVALDDETVEGLIDHFGGHVDGNRAGDLVTSSEASG
jgi:hypothetical protein